MLPTIKSPCIHKVYARVLKKIVVSAGHLTATPTNAIALFIVSLSSLLPIILSPLIFIGVALFYSKSLLGFYYIIELQEVSSKKHLPASHGYCKAQLRYFKCQKRYGVAPLGFAPFCPHLHSFSSIQTPGRKSVLFFPYKNLKKFCFYIKHFYLCLRLNKNAPIVVRLWGIKKPVNNRATP